MKTGNQSSGSHKHGPYVPALGVRALTRLYDPLLRLTLREEQFKRRLIAAARIQAGHSVLDVGCGTGTLALMLKCAELHAVVTGLDGDPGVLAIARKKVGAEGVDVQFREGLAYQLPFPDSSFDRVLSSLMFHHLTTADKLRSLEEVFRVLRVGGELHIADWGRPHNALMTVASLGIRLLDGAETTRANLDGEMPTLIENAGFKGVEEGYRGMTIFGTLSLYSGVRAA
ncbi:MAG: class I SAM-dependent methyltransferase [Hyphomicrobium sp.]|uniref:class I SAM-dependent methyltransferase n=1 Tax=Hyphomicrobium sp. TaxID=82 RepID=UPI003D0D007F